MTASGSTLAPVPCVFCGQDRKLTREHVFAAWLKEQFPELEEVEADYLRRLRTASKADDHSRPGPAFDYVTRDVCEVCNNGWMSHLETQVQPILTPMLAERPQVLGALDQTVLATWATKTALAMQGLNIGGERVFSEDQYRWFEQHRMPLPASHVWLCHYTDRTRWPVSAHQWGMVVGPTDDATLHAGSPMNSFGVAFAVGPVAFWLVGYDVPGGPHTAARSDDKHLLIWPALGPDVRWPPPNALETEQELMQLSRRLPDGTIIKGDLTVG